MYIDVDTHTQKISDDKLKQHNSYGKILHLYHVSVGPIVFVWSATWRRKTYILLFRCHRHCWHRKLDIWAGCSKLTMSLVNVALKF